MNKALLLGIGGVVVVGGIAWAVMSGGDEGDLSGGTTLAGQEETTLRALLGNTTPQKCVYAIPESPADETATAYIANGKLRLDVSSAEGVHSIMRDNVVYVWRDGAREGMRINAQAPTETQKVDSQNVGLDESVKASCEDWRVDASLFELPKGVTFQDLSALMPQTGAASGASAQCGMCASLPADQQGACKQALKCQ
ncbi:MAG: hypothetical protein AAB608_00725 [Patescibacteria group bacterium]